MSVPSDETAPTVPLTQIVLAGSLLFLSGQVPITGQHNGITAGGISEQTRAVLERIRNLLASEGSSLAEVVKTTL